MADTLNRAYPYPSTNDAPNGPLQLQQLAEAVDVDVAALDVAKWSKKNLKITGGKDGAAPAGATPILKVHRVGSTTTSGSGTIAITFPTAFPNSCASVYLTTVQGTGVAGVITSNAITKTGFTAVWPGVNNTIISFDYLAIGW